MIPEWCKRAVEEIRKHSVDILEGRCPDAGYMATIIAKHAPEDMLHPFAEKLTQVRELVEAAREALLMVGQSLPTAISDDKKWWESQANCLMRLDRALEPFNEVS